MTHIIDFIINLAGFQLLTIGDLVGNYSVDKELSAVFTARVTVETALDVVS